MQATHTHILAYQRQVWTALQQSSRKSDLQHERTANNNECANDGSKTILFGDCERWPSDVCGGRITTLPLTMCSTLLSGRPNATTTSDACAAAVPLPATVFSCFASLACKFNKFKLKLRQSRLVFFFFLLPSCFCFLAFLVLN